MRHTVSARRADPQGSLETRSPVRTHAGAMTCRVLEQGSGVGSPEATEVSKPSPQCHRVDGAGTTPTSVFLSQAQCGLNRLCKPQVPRYALQLCTTQAVPEKAGMEEQAELNTERTLQPCHQSAWSAPGWGSQEDFKELSAWHPNNKTSQNDSFHTSIT